MLVCMCLIEVVSIGFLPTFNPKGCGDIDAKDNHIGCHLSGCPIKGHFSDQTAFLVL